MYSEHFGFRCELFEDRADTRFTYLTPELEETLATLEYESRFGKGVALVLGEAGTGKTQILRTLLLRLHSTDHAVVVSVPTTGDFDLIREACKGFGVSLPSSNGPLARRMARLRRHLSRTAQAGHRSILIIDQGENLTANGLSQVASLTEQQDERGRLLSVFLFGQPRLRKLLEEPEFARLRQQFIGERVVRPFDEEQTGHYLRHRLRVAGAGEPDLMDAEAVHLLFAASNGVPRLINHFANEALISAYAAGVKRVTGGMVEEVIGVTESKARSASLSDLGLRNPRVGPGPGQDLGGPPVPISTRSTSEPARANPLASLRIAEPLDEGWAAERGRADFVGTPTSFDGTGVMTSAGAPSPLANSLESLFAQGGDLLERLERALAKAERTCSVSEASLIQHTAVEKHLSTLTAGAERILDSLTQSADRAQRTLSEAPQRLNEALAETEQRLAQLSGKMAILDRLEQKEAQRSDQLGAAQRQVEAAEIRLQNILHELNTQAESASQRTRRLSEELRAAARVQPDVERVIKQLGERVKESDAHAAEIEERQRRSADRSRELQAALDALDVKTTTVLEVTGKGLDGLAREASDIISRKREDFSKLLFELDAGARTLQVRSDEAVERFEAALQPVMERAAARGREQLEELQRRTVQGVSETLDVLSRKRESVSSLLIELEAGARTLQARGEEEVQKFESSLLPILEKATARSREQLNEQAAAFQRLQDEKLAATLGDYRERVEGLLVSTRRQAEELLPMIESVERRQRLIDSAATSQVEKVITAESDVSGLSEKADALSESIATMQNAVRTVGAEVDGLTAHATKVNEELSATVRQARDIFRETETARTTVDLIQKSVSVSVGDITLASERVGGLREQAAMCEQTATRLSRDLAVGQEVAAELSAATESASEIKRTLQNLTKESAERVGQLDSHNAAACRVRNELAAANAAANASLQRTDADRSAMAQIVNEARELAKRLMESQSAGDGTAQRLTELIAAADATYGRADGVLVGIDGHVRALAEGCQKADEILERISESSRSALEIVARAEETTIEAQTTAATTSNKMERLSRDVEALTGQSEIASRQLEAGNARAAELIGILSQATAPADAVVSKLSQHMDEADRHIQRIVRDSKEAQKLAERVVSITQVLAGAREAEASIQQTATDVQSLHDRFAALVAQAAQQSISLRETLVSVQNMTVEQEQARGDAESAIRRLEDHRATTESATRAGEELLREFIGQAESLERGLKELGRKVGDIESNVREAVSRRDETVGQAKAQTAQLERVGEAVRKVLAAVSQATLEARDRAKELAEANRASAEKMGVFTAETQRAAGTLHEWVREAVRAQERLERTMQIVPAIQQTHPRESLMGLARATTAHPRSVEPVALGELKTMVAPESTEPVSKPSSVQRPAPRTGRAGEIAQLIEDAKRATAEVG